SRLEVDYLNGRYNLDLPESEEYETLGGYIIHHAEDIPEQNAQISIDHFAFKIKEVSNARIELVELRVHQID
ncbi:MAG: transporter associated domain-containing protein, partial [Flavobacteriales bacterium]